MGLRLNSLYALKYCLPAKEVLSLGYPDILVPRETLKEIFGVDVEGETNFGKWHNVDFPLPESLEFFEKIGCNLKCIDIHASRGCEEIFDLNYRCDLGQYDLVIDGGTIEHCFHIGRALLNSAGAVKVGGRIIQGSPMNMMNHGFYNLSPTLLYDFYTQNDWAIEQFYAIDRKETIYQIPEVRRFQAPTESSLFVVAKRITGNPLKIPTQTKYIKNPGLA
jgi:hypothetical protein